MINLVLNLYTTKLTKEKENLLQTNPKLKMDNAKYKHNCKQYSINKKGIMLF